MKRRPLLLGLGASAAAALLWQRHFPAQAASEGGPRSEADIQRMQQQWREFLPADAQLPSLDTPLEISLEQWRERLSPAAYHVLFEEGTEAPYSSPLDGEKRPGVFACAACELPLFSSAMKYDSGTGWPSFFTVIPEHVGTKVDYKLILPRTEYHCARCAGHQGHVFEDGPAPTGLRYCNNGVALSFLASEPEESLT